MSTIQVTQEWQPQPSKSLVEGNPVKEGKKLSLVEDATLNRSHFCAADMMGLSWVLSDDILGDV